MQYCALLISRERDLTPDEGAAEMAAYEAFHAKAATAIRGGDALLPAATGVRITGGPDAPVITDGPFVEGAEVAGGRHLLGRGNNLRDDAAGRPGPQPLEATNWIALLLEPPERPVPPGTPEWEAMVVQHQQFGAAAGQHTQGGARLHPPARGPTRA